MVSYFIGVPVYIMTRTLRGHLEIRNFSSLVEEHLNSCLVFSLMKYFSTLEKKFGLSVQPVNILYTEIAL